LMAWDRLKTSPSVFWADSRQLGLSPP